jgi:transcriptional regulator with XRE-family HTH domain
MATSRKNMSDEEWDLLKQIGQKFKEIRLRSNLTQIEAAKQVSMRQARIPVLENGQADVMITTLSRWAKVYGYEINIELVPIPAEESEAA